jgi:nucleoside-diphosphate-sugar epimerase
MKMKPAIQLTAPNEATPSERFIINRGDPILITGANGFIGPHVLKSLLNLGFCNLRCFVRPTSDLAKIDALVAVSNNGARIEVIRGNLLSVSDCIAATKDVAVVIHLAAGRGEKSFPDAFLNSVVTTRNLLEASLAHQYLKRFVNVSSFAVYDNKARSSNTLDETCPLEEPAHRRGEAYCFAKIKQDQLVVDYGKRFSIPYVIVRPGYVYGPGKKAISGRVGLDTFGVFLHLGGANTLPFTYVENCADAIALAGVMPGVDGEVFNVVDDELPSSRGLLRLYKKKVKRFSSVYVPHVVSYALCRLWEWYSAWSEEQLPPAFNRSRWCANWRSTRYSNQKLKTRLGWKPRVSTSAGLALFFEGCRQGASRA